MGWKSRWVAAALAFSFAEACGAIQETRKVIAIGWEFKYTPPAEIARHADTYRGLGISGADFSLYGRLPDGKLVEALAMPKDHPWTREAFAEDEKALGKLAQMPEFSHSFIATVTCPCRRIAWNDDEAWARYAKNVNIRASIAHDAGMVGVSVDNEDYSQCRQFRLVEGDGTYAEASALARKRGREIFAAVFSAFPGAKVHFDRLYTQDLWEYYAACDNPRGYAEERGDLWVPFVDGAMEAIDSTGVFYEGDETGYRYAADHNDAAVARARNQIDLARVVDPALREKYRAKVRNAFPLYLDRYVQTNPSSRYWAGPDGGSRLARFERDIASALASSDDYVWLYGEQRTLAAWRRPDGFCKGSGKGLETWDDVLPGFSVILSAAKEPVAFGKNILDGLKAAGHETTVVCGKFADGPLPRPLSGWQAKTQPGRFGASDGMLFAEGVGNGGISFSTCDVKEGDRWAVDFEVKGIVGYTLVRFHRTGAVADLSFPPTEMYEPPAGDTNGWRRFSRTVRVPHDVENMLVSINVRQKPGEKAYIRNFAVKRIVRFDAMPEPPFEITASGSGFSDKLERSGSKWIGDRTSVELVEAKDGLKVLVSAPSSELNEIRLAWKTGFLPSARILLDKSSGAWTSLEKGGDSSGYFLVDHGVRTDGWGAKVQPDVSVCWRLKPRSAEAIFDVRKGDVAACLGKKVVEIATIVRREGLPGESPLAAARVFNRMICPAPKK